MIDEENRSYRAVSLRAAEHAGDLLHGSRCRGHHLHEEARPLTPHNKRADHPVGSFSAKIPICRTV